jgi:hypothetical protein
MSAEFDSAEPMAPATGDSGAFLDAVAEALIAAGTLQAPALARARRVSAETGERLDAALTKLGLVSDKDLARAMAQTAGLELAGDDDFPQDPVFETALSARFLRQAHGSRPNGRSSSASRRRRKSRRRWTGSTATRPRSRSLPATPGRRRRVRPMPTSSGCATRPVRRRSSDSSIC